MRVPVRGTFVRASVTLFATFFAATIADATLHVVPDDYVAIQLAIEAAADGDSVMIRPGTYVETLGFSGKDITLFGETDAASTVIRGFGFSVLELGAGVTPATSIENLTFAEGVSKWGGALQCTAGASPTVRRCRFIGNLAEHPNLTAYGGAIYGGMNSDLLIEDCHFEGNRAVILTDVGWAGGGAIYMRFNSDLTVRRSTFVSNSTHSPDDFGSSGGAIFPNGDSCVIEDCRFEGNTSVESGGAIYATNDYLGSLILNRSTFVGNSAARGGAIHCYLGQIEVDRCVLASNGGSSTIYIRADIRFSNNTVVYGDGDGIRVDADGGPPLLWNNIVAFNSGRGIMCYSVPPDSTIACNDVWNNTQNYGHHCPDLTGVFDNISQDPIFCNDDLDDLDLALSSDSPCLPTANACGLVGALEVGCEPTAIEAGEAQTRMPALSVHPNPIVTGATFRLDAGVGAEIEIYDPLGRLVEVLQTEGRARMSWSPAVTSPAGVYFARIERGGRSHIVRLTVMR